MKVAGNTLIVLIVIGLSLFGILRPKEYVEKENILFLVSLNSIVIFYFCIINSDLFKKSVLEASYKELFIGFKWVSFFHFFILVFTPLLLSIPFLIAKKLTFFVIISSVCYFQAIIVVSTLKFSFDFISKKTWFFIAILLIVILGISDKTLFGDYILFHPLAGAAYIPYHFKMDLSILNVIISIIITYSWTALMYLAQILIKKKCS